MVKKKAAQHAGRVPLVLPSSQKPRQLPAEPALAKLEVDSSSAKRAVEALIAHAHKRKRSDTSLFEAEERLELIITTKRVAQREKTMPVRLRLPHSVIDPRQQSVCLLVKDPQRQYKDLLEAKHVTFISKVVGVTKLKGKYKPFEARRQLMRDHDLFLADDSIIPMMPKLLGRNWLEAKKQPIPVTLTRSDLKAELERAISSTYLYIGRGTCLSVKLGVVDVHAAEELLDNVLAVIPQLAVRLPQGGWGNVQSLALKTSTSVSLPIWQCKLDGEEETGRFFKPEWTVEPPFVSKKSARFDLEAARAELEDSEEEALPVKKRKSTGALEESDAKRQKISKRKKVPR